LDRFATLSGVFEDLRFRIATNICQLWPPGPERDWRLALLDVTIKRAIEHAKKAQSVPMDVQGT
jgi:hypothetical protein